MRVCAIVVIEGAMCFFRLFDSAWVFGVDLPLSFYSFMVFYSDCLCIIWLSSSSCSLF